MITLPPIDLNDLEEILVQMLNIPSPTGHTQELMEWLRSRLGETGFPAQFTNKGALYLDWEGDSDDRPRAVTVHVDTLGAMVKEIKMDGRLRLSRLGGFAWNTVEGEGCTVLPADGQPVRGTLLPIKASGHIHGKAVAEQDRDDEHMEVRLDIRTEDAEGTRGSGIGVGDYVAFDPRVEVTPTGFIRSRYLDDKASAACLLVAMRCLQDAGVLPSQQTRIHFSNFEEVGHGAASGFPADLVELLVVDIGIAGQGQNSDEFSVTLCAKDSSGPYHPALTAHLRRLAEDLQISYKMDVFPHYSSDGSAFWKAGGDVQVALIGPGVDASHSYERVHIDGLDATAQLIAAYLIS